MSLKASRAVNMRMGVSKPLSRSFWASSNPSIAGQHDAENHEVEGARHCEVEPFWAVCREGRDMAFLLEASLQEGRHALVVLHDQDFHPLSLGENSEGMLKPRTQRPATSSQWVRRFTHRNAT